MHNYKPFFSIIYKFQQNNIRKIRFFTHEHLRIFEETSRFCGVPVEKFSCKNNIYVLIRIVTNHLMMSSLFFNFNINYYNFQEHSFNCFSLFFFVCSAVCLYEIKPLITAAGNKKGLHSWASVSEGEEEGHCPLRILKFNYIYIYL